MTVQNEMAQAGQQEMLKQLREMSEVVRSTRSLDWNPVRFQLTEETPGGPPAVGFSIALKERVPGAGPNGLEPQPTERETDGSGVADFGVVHPGDYDFQISKNWDAEYLVTSGQLRIEPGSQINQRIVCPRTPLESVPVRIRWNWPADLEKEKLSLYATFTHKTIEREGLSWTLSDDRYPNSPSKPWRRGVGYRANSWPAIRSVLSGPAMSVAQILPLRQPHIWTEQGSPFRDLSAELRTSDLREIREPGDSLKWERGDYYLSGVLVLRQNNSDDRKSGKRRLRCHGREPATAGWDDHDNLRRMVRPPYGRRRSSNRSGCRAKCAQPNRVVGSALDFSRAGGRNQSVYPPGSLAQDGQQPRGSARSGQRVDHFPARGVDQARSRAPQNQVGTTVSAAIALAFGPLGSSCQYPSGPTGPTGERSSHPSRMETRPHRVRTGSTTYRDKARTNRAP